MSGGACVRPLLSLPHGALKFAGSDIAAQPPRMASAQRQRASRRQSQPSLHMDHCQQQALRLSGHIIVVKMPVVDPFKAQVSFPLRGLERNAI